MRFRRLHPAGPSLVTVTVEGRTVQVPAGETVAAVVLAIGLDYTRTTPVTGSRRAPYCMMGACFECLMEIDGVPFRQACLVPVAEGMRISRQLTHAILSKKTGTVA